MKYYTCPKCKRTYSIKEFKEDRFCRKCGSYLYETVEKESFEKIWKRIIFHEGETFQTKKGEKFTYEVKGSIVHPSRTDWNISKSDFARAHRLVPISGPGLINQIVMGPAYVWGILHDARISLGEW